MKTMKHTAKLILALGLAPLLASESRAALAYGLTPTGLLQFDTASPGTITNTATFSGLLSGDTIADVDFRPQDGNLYGLAPSGRLYVLNPITGAASLNTTGSMGTVQRMDFNPVANRLRVFSSLDQNYRITPGTGVVSIDGVFSFAAGDVNAGANPMLSSAAYTNNFVGGGTTTLFSVDSDLDILISHSGAPQFSTLNTIGSLGVNIGTNVGFDINGVTNTAFLSNGQDFYGVNLATGALTSLGTIGGSGVMGLAVVPEPSAAGLSLLALLGIVSRRRRRATL
jgi:Domain of unknown function (DUF4394)